TAQRHATHAPAQNPSSAASHSSSYSRAPLPQIARSHASPIASSSPSVWDACATNGQSSVWSGTPSASLSGLAGTIDPLAPRSHKTPGGQSVSVVHVRWALAATTGESLPHLPISDVA